MFFLQNSQSPWQPIPKLYTPATFKFELHSGQLQALCSTVPGRLHQNESLKCDLFDVKMQIRCSVCFVEFFGRVSKVFHDMTKYHDVGKIMCTFHIIDPRKTKCIAEKLSKENRSMFQSILSLGRMFNHKSHYQVPPVERGVPKHFQYLPGFVQERMVENPGKSIVTIVNGE